eukprot:707029-Pelagomonas_calceolata.AAC.1
MPTGSLADVPHVAMQSSSLELGRHPCFASVGSGSAAYVVSLSFCLLSVWLRMGTHRLWCLCSALAYAGYRASRTLLDYYHARPDHDSSNHVAMLCAAPHVM